MPRDVAADTRTATASVAATAADRQTDRQTSTEEMCRSGLWLEKRSVAVWQLHNRVKCILRIS